jgi:hypothetical protein
MNFQVLKTLLHKKQGSYPCEKCEFYYFMASGSEFGYKLPMQMRIKGKHINADPETPENFILFSSDHKSKDKNCSVADPGWDPVPF